MRIRSVLLITVIGVAPIGSAQTQSKQPWELPLEERIARRTDARQAQERLRGRARVKSMVRDTATQFVDVFDGKTHPELFLPHQVFRTLMNHAFLRPERSGSLFRQALAPEVAQHGLPADFWDRLRAVSAANIADATAVDEMIATLPKVHGRARRDAAAALDLKQMDTCRSAADALAAARREFGGERFDRFLYEVIAVNMFHAADRLPTAEELRIAERGCR